MDKEVVELEGDPFESPESVISPQPNLQPATYQPGQESTSPSSYRRARNATGQLPRLEQIASPALSASLSASLSVALRSQARRRRPTRQHTLRDVRAYLEANNLTNAQLPDHFAADPAP